MDVRKLKTTMEQKGNKNASNTLTSVSHWVRKIFDSNKGQLETSSIEDMETLEKLVHLGIVSLKRGSGDMIITELTKEGRELYMDFVKLGYYL